MADTTISQYLTSYEQIQANYEKYADRFSDSSADLVNSETFLSLLVAEMTNQDPLEPTSNTEFVTQMAQFTSLQYAQESSTYAQANYAASLVGKTVTASKMEGSEYVVETGVVESVVKNGSTYNVSVNGQSFDISKITSVSTTVTESDTSSTDTVNSTLALGDTIAKASLMIGMYATVSATTDSGTVMDAGVIDSIQVKSGEVYVVIDDIAYKLTDVVEVKYPEYEIVDEVTDTTDAVTETESTEADSSETEAEEAVTEITAELTGDSYEEEDVADLEDIAEETEEI